MKRFLLLGAIALLLAGTTDAFAQYRNRSGRYNNAQDRRQIQRGIRSGRITRDEARAIREREQQIRTERRGYRADGTLTREERREIRSDERGQDRYVREQIRDDDHRRRYNSGRYDRRRGNGYYRRGAGSRSHPVFGRRNR
ncbi:MAG: hypothetical protein AABN95_23615 [Acidobacteriota bacterium]